MSIKKTIKLNIYMVCFLLTSILVAKYYVLQKIETNYEHKNSISKLIFLQDDMNSLIFDVTTTLSPVSLARMKNKFDELKNQFDEIKNNLNTHLSETHHISHDSTFNTIITEDFKKLLSHKNDGVSSFDVLSSLQNNKISMNKELNQNLPIEKRLRKSIKGQIIFQNKIDTYKNFVLLEYYSKEALFQYKEKKYFDKWMHQVILLKNKTMIFELAEYLQVIDILSININELNDIKKIEVVLLQNIKNIRLENKQLKQKISFSVEKFTQKLSKDLNYMLIVLILFVLIIVILMGMKIYNNIGLSVDETNAKIEFEVNENRKKDELLAHQSKLVAMGEMMGNIAHQWRQPLNALAGNIQFLREDHEDGAINEKFLDKFIKQNMDCINFMSKTIDDFRNFFKTDKIKSNFSILSCLQKPLDILTPQLDEYHISLEITGDDFMVYDLQSEFQQVILNIVNNSKDALVDNKIEKAKITVSTYVDDSSGYILIQDNAGGIPSEIITRVFEPYFTTKEQGKGTGIGLYMSKMIVSNMKGNISVKNAEEGACFEIKLPISET